MSLGKLPADKIANNQVINSEITIILEVHILSLKPLIIIILGSSLLPVA